MTRTLRVLYVHPFAAHGGATKSLAEMIKAFPLGSVRGTVIVPAGAATELLAALGLEVILVRGIAQWDDTRFGYYRRLRWLIGAIRCPYCALREGPSWIST